MQTLTWVFCNSIGRSTKKLGPLGEPVNSLQFNSFTAKLTSNTADWANDLLRTNLKKIEKVNEMAAFSQPPHYPFFLSRYDKIDSPEDWGTRLLKLFSPI